MYFSLSTFKIFSSSCIFISWNDVHQFSFLFCIYMAWYSLSFLVHKLISVTRKLLDIIYWNIFFPFSFSLSDISIILDLLCSHSCWCSIPSSLFAFHFDCFWVIFNILIVSIFLLKLPIWYCILSSLCIIAFIYLFYIVKFPAL